MDYRIKDVEKDDLYDYLNVNTIAWNESYKGIIPDWFLNKIKLEINKNVKMLEDKFDKEKIEEPYNKKYLLYINNEPGGMFSIDKSRIEDYPNSGELCSIYLLNKYKGKGYGTKMFEKAVEELRKMKFKNMVIGCLKDNPSNKFYIKKGGNLVKTRIINIANEDLEENIYYFKKI